MSFQIQKIATFYHNLQNCDLWKISKCDEMLLYRRGVLVGNSVTDGRAIYNKYSPLTTCVIQMYFHSQKKKKITNGIVTGGRPMTS